MSIVLTIADSQDGATATATITGSTGGTTNTVYYQRVDTVLTAGTWASGGSRTADGTVTLTLPPAYYWAYVSNNNAGTITFSNIAYFPISRDDASLYDRFLDAIVSRIQTLSLTGLATPPGNIPAVRVVRFDTLDSVIMQSVGMPCIVVSSLTAEAIENGTTSREDIGMPALVSIIDRASPSNQTTRPSYYLWRQQISWALRWQRLGGMPEIFKMTVEPREINAWKQPENELYYSAQLFRGFVRDPRGV